MILIVKQVRNQGQGGDHHHGGDQRTDARIPARAWPSPFMSMRRVIRRATAGSMQPAEENPAMKTESHDDLPAETEPRPDFALG